ACRSTTSTSPASAPIWPRRWRRSTALPPRLAQTVDVEDREVARRLRGGHLRPPCLALALVEGRPELLLGDPDGPADPGPALDAVAREQALLDGRVHGARLHGEPPGDLGHGKHWHRRALVSGRLGWRFVPLPQTRPVRRTQLLRSRADPPRDGRFVGINHFGDLVNALALSVHRPGLLLPQPVPPGPAAAGAEKPVRS